MLEICHDGRVHSWETICTVDPHNELGALSFCCHSRWDQKVSVRKHFLFFILETWIFLRLNVILIPFTLSWYLDSITLSNDTNVTLQIPLRTSSNIIWVC